MKQKAPNSNVRESRAATQVQRREDVNCVLAYNLWYNQLSF